VKNWFVNNRLVREISKRNSHPRLNSLFTLSLGKVHFVVIGMKRNKQILTNAIRILIVVPKTLPPLFILKCKKLQIDMSTTQGKNCYK
jgi:predicted aldo/keto reductase-like oxidoreductase